MTAQNKQGQPTINIQLFGGLIPYRPNTPAYYPVVPGMTVLKLVEQLAIPAGTAVMAFINGKNVALDSLLQGNEEVKIFPLMGGG